MSSVLTLTAWASREGGGLQSAVRDLVRASTPLPCADTGGSPPTNALTQTVLSLADAHSAADLADWLPLTPQLHRFIGPDNFRFSPALLLAALRTAPDCIHQHGIWMFPSLVVRLLLMRSNTPLIISPHGMLDPWILARGRAKKRLVGLLWEHHNWRRARAFRALSLAEALAIRAVVPKAPIALIANGVDLPDLSDSPSPLASSISDNSAKNSRAKDGGAKGGFTLLFLGRLHEKKGVHKLLDAWSVLIKKHPLAPPQLRICGWGDAGYEARCRAQASALGLDGTVRFVGPVFGADKDRELRQCDALILPSVSEGLPMAILEAWSYAKPTLMTTQCNLDIGFNQGCALRIGHEPADIAAQINQLIAASAHDRANMAQRARQLVERDYSWPRIARQVDELTRWCIGAGPRPDSLY